MKILLIGAGAREHALAWKLNQSPLLKKLWVSPGNPGTAQFGKNVELDLQNNQVVVAFAKEHKVDLVIVGPEDPLANGLADELHAAGISCFGPEASPAELESSKAFCKEVMVRHRIPTASYRVFNSLNPAISYLEGGCAYPVVVKASGLAAGKGVYICETLEAARNATKAMLEEGRHGDAGRTVILEEFLAGPEASAFALTDGRTILPLETCQDHKQRYEGGEGANTGGMGAISPNPLLSERARDAVERQVLVPTVHGMNHEGRRFRGVLFAGLKLTTAGPKVLEYNVRFGDPECQVLMMRFKSDLLPYLKATADGTLEELEAPEWDPRPCVTVVAVSKGYPGKYKKGIPITGLDDVECDDELQVFHAGTKLSKAGELQTNGGRVLSVTALGDTLSAARKRAYATLEQIDFAGKGFRNDIGNAGVEAMERIR